MSDTSLTTVEQRTLAELESVIECGVETFKEVGAALLDIREGKLYRGSHGTFENYCHERWGMTKQHAYRLINSTESAERVSKSNQLVTPSTESQARPLTKLEPEQQPEAWSKAVEIAGGKQPTAKQVEEAVEIVRPEQPRNESDDDAILEAYTKRQRAEEKENRAAASDAIKAIRRIKPGTKWSWDALQKIQSTINNIK